MLEAIELAADRRLRRFEELGRAFYDFVQGVSAAKLIDGALYVAAVIAYSPGVKTEAALLRIDVN